ncbi:Gfo/Idh/MocA family oxidoreductase [Listeria sp. FSL L7-1509]|uniref:Gfo/Idh/MocA family oxidoreductase n=1 Tax=Listeria immobilis TaxID=2713502 RepID=A0ABR6SWU9_9LIST|nr:Gfo/Idh/MocA family oxidoreductase [Listeria immobilis]MBC1484283.1 Gfo/Idh/MocA family oxidoreductase [Listeria immobilis]MBC1506887.1 Gfo/Idh/MocA family oxidoreductase [Listeria immobilis]MBC1510099.1 Gfo/Idh/MocA family oxidoreductase [Listeria immobilis]MBC6304585.1 Gfo/Idh/MocA family oxidoreductase [Listeria immobilis]MBC6312425.1 Gfo/Idh/MocA family oxidoreductase [Listeria immobilis]
MSLKVGIIGCGGIANGKHMPSLLKAEKAEMVAFCDIILEKAEAAAEVFGGTNASVYTNYQDLLQDKSIDVIHVCTPNISHAEISIAALEAGKHVMCEKPMAKTTEEARNMIKAAERTGKKLTIGYQNRFRKDSNYLHQICENKELGDIYYAKAKAIRRRAVPTWGVFLDEEAQGGGPLIDIGTHALDLTLWMMDNYKPKYVVGNSYHKLSEKENAANAWGSWDPKKFTVEDSAFGFITMENGATIVLEASWALNTLDVGEARTSLSGTEGGADMEDGLRINGEAYSQMYEKKIQLDADGVDFYDGEGEDPALIEAEQWLDAILNNTEPVVKPAQALVVTQILEAIYESAKTGKPVYFN